MGEEQASTRASRWSPRAARARAGWPSARRPRRSRPAAEREPRHRAAPGAQPLERAWSSRARSCAPCARPRAGELRVLGEEGGVLGAAAREPRRSGRRRAAPAIARPPSRVDRRARGLRGRGRRPASPAASACWWRWPTSSGAARARADRGRAGRGRPWRSPPGTRARRRPAARGARTTTWSRSTRRPGGGGRPAPAPGRRAPTWPGARPRPSSRCTCGAPSSTCGRRSPSAYRALRAAAGRRRRRRAPGGARGRRALPARAGRLRAAWSRVLERAGLIELDGRSARLPRARGRRAPTSSARPPTAPARERLARDRARAGAPSCPARRAAAGRLSRSRA